MGKSYSDWLKKSNSNWLTEEIMLWIIEEITFWLTDWGNYANNMNCCPVSYLFVASKNNINWISTETVMTKIWLYILPNEKKPTSCGVSFSLWGFKPCELLFWLWICLTFIQMCRTVDWVLSTHLASIIRARAKAETTARG